MSTKVKDLIKQLSKCNQEAYVVIKSSDNKDEFYDFTGLGDYNDMSIIYGDNNLCCISTNREKEYQKSEIIKSDIDLVIIDACHFIKEDDK